VATTVKPVLLRVAVTLGFPVSTGTEGAIAMVCVGAGPRGDVLAAGRQFFGNRNGSGDRSHLQEDIGRGGRWRVGRTANVVV
jgi:hypothetical protein